MIKIFLFNNKTYFFISTEMITIENSEEFINALISSTIETITTNHPTMIKFKDNNKIFHFIIGYNDILVTIIENNKIRAESLGKDLLEFAEELICQLDKALIYFKSKPKIYKNIKSLYDELIETSSSAINVCNCYDIRKKTLDDIIYSYENEHSYAIIYDQLDDLSETYRVVNENSTYLISVNALAIDVITINIGRNEFSKILYNELKKTNNPHIKKTLKILNKYIKEQKTPID